MQTIDMLGEEYAHIVDMLLYGGCQLFALELYKKIGGEILYFNDSDGYLEHVCIKKNNIFYDASGSTTEDDIIYRYPLVDLSHTTRVSSSRVEEDMIQAEVMELVEANDVFLDDILVICDKIASTIPKALEQRKAFKPY